MLDLRGKLYEIKNKQFNVVVDMAKEKPKLMPEPGLGSGWGTFVFHRLFKERVNVYHPHRKKGSAPADFAYADVDTCCRTMDSYRMESLRSMARF